MSRDRADFLVPEKRESVYITTVARENRLGLQRLQAAWIGVLYLSRLYYQRN